MEALYLLSYRGVFVWWGREDSNLRRRSRQIYSLLPLATRAHPQPRTGFCPETLDYGSKSLRLFNTTVVAPSTEPGKGVEPPTGRLQGGCSTTELPGQEMLAASTFDRPYSTVNIG